MNRLVFPIAAALALITMAGAGPAERLTLPQRAELLPSISAARTQADTDRNKLFDNLEAALAVTPAEQPLEVIVRYQAGQEGAAAEIAERVTRRLSADRSVAARLTGAEIRRLAASGAVESIEQNRVVSLARATSQSSFGTTQASLQFGLTGNADGDAAVYSPRDATIAVIDTGIDGRHPGFAGGKIIGWKDFISDRPEAYDDSGHGTHVAGIAAGAVVEGIGGVAPGASLVGVKVFDAADSSTAGLVAAGIDWCIENRERHGIDVLNLSLSDDQSSDGTDLLSRAVDRAAAAGLVVCIAAGNMGPNNFTIGSGAAAAGAITVGNMADLGKAGFFLRGDSGRGPTADGRVKPDLCAPGTGIVVATGPEGAVRRTGTSMATPFVAGVAALMRQANPALTPEAVKTILKETAIHFGPAGENTDFGAGRLDAFAALARAAGKTGTPPEVPDHLFSEGALATTNDYRFWDLPIDDARFPIAVTLLIHDPGPDFDLFLYDPQGRLNALSDGVRRQETIGIVPAGPGTYRLVARSYSGAGRFTIDVSAGTSLK